MCRNYDRNRNTTNLNDPLSSQFKKTFDNTVKVVAQLCVDLGIVANKSNIKQHKDWSGKHCPSKILNDKTWDQLVNGIIAEYNRLKGKTDVKPNPKPESKPKPAGKYKGDSIVDYLKSIDIDSSATNRKKLAKEYGVSGYDLSSAKNLELLKAMRDGKKPASKPKPKPSKPAGEYTGNSIVDYLKSEGINSSLANRKKLAKQYGIKGYTGTAKQNEDLLNKMRKESAPKKSKPKGNQKTNSIVDYLKSIEVDSSMANRKKLAAKHGIKNYSGTQAQNDKLLKKLRG